MTRLAFPIGLLVAVALSLAAVAKAPAGAAFAGAVALAVAWCRWLEAHPGIVPEDAAHRAVSQELFRNSLADAQAGTPIVEPR
jgi:hypothetical protein